MTVEHGAPPLCSRRTKLASLHSTTFLPFLYNLNLFNVRASGAVCALALPESGRARRDGVTQGRQRARFAHIDACKWTGILHVFQYCWITCELPTLVKWGPSSIGKR